ncbi:MAG: hypothetical protein WDN02_10990 [Methylovirgula sp.]|uniref:phosphorylase family protein n=1 Tax=Methylovirgula sp. TaxID=1978224 RepID=UPI003076859D
MATNLRARKAFDVCVICAKSEEARSVIGTFRKTSGFELIPGRENGFIVAGSLTVKVTTCIDMGHMSAAVRVAQVITESNPEIIIFVGTAASLKPSQIQLGDVVIPKKAVIRRYDKISEKGQPDYDERKQDSAFKEFFFEETALISELSTISYAVEASDLIAALEIDNIALESEVGTTMTLGDEELEFRAAKIHDDVDIFSCGMVIDSIAYRRFITTNAHNNLRKAAIVDMESHGFFTAIQSIPKSSINGSESNRCHGIMIRGISDYAGRKSQTELRPVKWKDRAVKNAAVVTAALLSVIGARALTPDP